MQVGFLDAEGQGDRSVNYDIQLVSPLLLLATTVIFNWFGRPEKDTMLVKLGCLAKAAQRIDMSEGSTGPPFGHLHVVLRDNPDLTGVESLLLDDEGAEFVAAGKPMPEDFDTRNKVRALLRSGFKSIQIWGLPAPVENTQLAFTSDDVSLAFRGKVDELRVAICAQLIEPRVIEGSPLTATMAGGLAKALAAAVNENADKISPASAFEAMQQMEVKMMVQKAVTELSSFVAGLCELVGKHSVMQAELETAFEKKVQESLATFDTSAATLLSASRLDAAHSEIHEASAALLTRLLDANEKAQLRLGAVRSEISLAFSKFASSRKAELEANKNTKARAEFHTEVEEHIRRVLDDELPAALSAAGLEGGYDDLRTALEEEISGEARRLSIANRNAHRRINGEVVAEDMEWKFEPVLMGVAFSINHWKESEKRGNKSSLYRVAVSVGPSDGSAVKSTHESSSAGSAKRTGSAKSLLRSASSNAASAGTARVGTARFPAMFPPDRSDVGVAGKEYCISVWRNYNHFLWLDTKLRSDPKCKAELKGIKLPVEAKPRSLLAPSTWLATKRKKADRVPHLNIYLEKLSALESTSSSEVLKIFLSPDDIFRPIRNATKGLLFSSQDKVIAKQLAKLKKTPRFNSRSDGVRLQLEQQCFPLLVEWTLLQVDKHLHSELATRYSKGSSEITSLGEDCHEMTKEGASGLKGAEQVELEHVARMTELETTITQLKVRIEYERVLVDRQKAASMVIYQPNHAYDNAAECDQTRMLEILDRHDEERKANVESEAFVAGALGAVQASQQQLLNICGDNDSVERYREWLTMHEDATWKLTSAREADKIFREAAAEKKQVWLGAP